MGERLGLHREVFRTARLTYRAEYPWSLQLSTVLPRLILQCAFYALLGRALGGAAGARAAFVGAAAYSATGISIVGACDLPTLDRWSDTVYRLQTAVISPVAVYLYRSLPYAVDGMAAVVAVTAVDGPLLGLGPTALDTAAQLPVLFLAALSCTMFGLAMGAVAIGTRQDVLLGNLAAYLVLAFSGVVAPVGAGVSWLKPVAAVLPLTHGLAAARAGLAGLSVWPQAGAELLVCAGWLAAAAGVVLARYALVRR